MTTGYFILIFFGDSPNAWGTIYGCFRFITQ